MAMRIMVVDDEKNIRDLLEIFLEKKGFGVVLASNAEDALNIAAVDKEINLAILDNRMPGIQGADIIDRLKGMSPGIKVLLLTGSISSTQRDVPFDAFLRKPIDLYKLLEMINQIIPPTA
jgi:DNA-binding NtrC family response regulator